MGPAHVGGGASWVLLGGPAGGQAAGIGVCLLRAVGVACGCQLGGRPGRCSGRCDVLWAGWGCVVHGLGHHVTPRGRLFCVGGSVVAAVLSCRGNGCVWVPGYFASL
jgi:hypothetical protein